MELRNATEKFALRIASCLGFGISCRAGKIQPKQNLEPNGQPQSQSVLV